MTLAQAEALLGIDANDMRLLARKGVLPEQYEGFLPLVKTVQRYIGHLKANIGTIPEAAAAIGISVQMMTRMSKGGFITSMKREDILVGAIKYYRDEARRINKTVASDALRQAKQQEIELRLAEKSGSLVKVEEAERRMEKLVGVINERFNGLAARVTRDVSLRRKIDDEVNEALNAAANQLLSISEDIEESGDDDPPRAKAAPRRVGKKKRVSR
jgi:hypothetical protein